MATSIRGADAASYAPPAAGAVTAARAVPWYLYAVVVAATSVVVGVWWDIAWHMSIGRDTFWSPPHMATYFSAIVVGVSCGYLAFKTTFAGTDAERGRAVGFWGFRAPLGAWVCVWGAIAMLTSAPFDDWWHNAYGLDVKIISPPHALLSLGMAAIVVGALLMSAAWQNRVAGDAPAGTRERLERLFLYSAGLLLAMVAVFTTDYHSRTDQHTTRFYRVASMAFPIVLLAAARAARGRWAATTVAGVYMGVYMLLGWIIPRFPATPKLGPIYYPLDHFNVLEFPLVLIVPAALIDLAMQRLGRDGPPRRDWATAPLYAALFLAALFAVQWPFAEFLHSPLARNWFFFADDNFTYWTPPMGIRRTYRFPDVAADKLPWAWPTAIAVALLYGTISSGIGLAWGRWMARVRR